MISYFFFNDLKMRKEERKVGKREGREGGRKGG